MDLAWTSPLHIESKVQLGQTYAQELSGSVGQMLGPQTEAESNDST